MHTNQFKHTRTYTLSQTEEYSLEIERHLRMERLQKSALTSQLQVLQFAAVCCSLLQCLQCLAVSCSACVTVCCSVVRGATVCYSVLQCATVCCSSVLQCAAVCCGVLQCIARYASAVQCVAAYCTICIFGDIQGIQTNTASSSVAEEYMSATIDKQHRFANFFLFLLNCVQVC